MPYKAVFL